MSEFTPWFPAHVKPVRKGLYQTQQPDGTQFYNLFDGENWRYGNFACEMPKSRARLPSYLLAKWRGLGKNPDA